jgi:hypothetical protein
MDSAIWATRKSACSGFPTVDLLGSRLTELMLSTPRPECWQPDVCIDLVAHLGRDVARDLQHDLLRVLLRKLGERMMTQIVRPDLDAESGANLVPRFHAVFGQKPCRLGRTHSCEHGKGSGNDPVE